MKRGIGIVTAFFVLVMTLLVTVSPLTVLAASGEYYISDIEIHAVANEQGDMLVEENYRYVFKGSFNGIKRNIKTKGSSGVSDISVEVLSNGKSEKGKLEINTSADETEVKIFSKSNNETKNFKISYKVKGVITKYSDLAELKWLFYENEDNVDTGKITVYLSLPRSITSEVKYLGEGPKRGTASLEDENRMKFQLQDMEDHEVIGAQVLFPAAWVNTSNIKNMNRDDYYLIKKKQTTRAIAIATICIIGAIGSISSILYVVYKKREKAIAEYRKSYIFFNDPYYSQLPSNLPPATVARLINNKVDNKDLLATILYLANKGAINFLKDGMYDKNYNNLRFTINYYAGIDELSESERYLLNWLSEYSDNGEIQLASLKKKAGKLEFITKYDKWKGLISQEVKDHNFYTIVKGKQILTNKYEDEKRKWIAFRNYLTNSGQEQRIYLEEQGLWEKIVPYAITLDAMESMLRYAKKDEYHYNNTNNICMNYWFLHYYTSTYRRDFDKTYSQNMSSSSSGNFSGSSGGGFGGGGGSSAF